MKLGLEKLEKYAKMFGFGDKTFIDLPNESRGKFPTVDWAKSKFGASGLPLGYMANYGIGQGEIGTTPLQMAVYASTLANNGTVYQPHVVRYVHNNITNKIEPIGYGSKTVAINREYFDIVHKGMFEVVNTAGGTASSAQIPGISVCGKTGTAQNPHGLDHSWFICYAPKDNPQIAMCVFVENAGFGGAVAAPIAKSFLTAYFYPDQLKQLTNPSSTYSNTSEPAELQNASSETIKQ